MIDPRNEPTSNISLKEIEDRVAAQRAWFANGHTRPVAHRVRALQSFRDALKRHEQDILDALQADLGKSYFEGYATELGLVYDEISFAVKHMHSWAKPKRVRSSIAHFPSKSTVYPQPKGVVLILSPWNYPLLLALSPLIDAISAGNCVALKPSRSAPATSSAMAMVIAEAFDPLHVAFFHGGGQINDYLLQVRFDHICFTGSTRIGRVVMEAASKFLTPVTLELGGKSPCVVTPSANIEIAAERIIWGKCVNAGQTCVAPDYLLVHESVHDRLLERLPHYIHAFYGEDPLTCDEYPRIISKKQFDKLTGWLDVSGTDSRIITGGRFDEETLKIEPTIVDRVSPSDPLMQEEIFGPILPVLTYKTLDEVIDFVNSREHPLAAYVFGEDDPAEYRFIHEVPFGGGTMNDTLIHLSNHNMPFGGIGNSGMGHYHGKWGFDTFTHYKSIQRKGIFPNIKIRNLPAGDKIKYLRMLLK